MAKQFIIMEYDWGSHSLPCASFDKLEDAMSHVNKLQKGTLDCYDIVDIDSLKIIDKIEDNINTVAKQFIIIADRHWGGHAIPCASFDKLSDAIERAKELNKDSQFCYEVIDTDSLEMVYKEECELREKQKKPW